MKTKTNLLTVFGLAAVLTTGASSLADEFPVDFDEDLYDGGIGIIIEDGGDEGGSVEDTGLYPDQARRFAYEILVASDRALTQARREARPGAPVHARALRNLSLLRDEAENLHGLLAAGYIYPEETLRDFQRTRLAARSSRLSTTQGRFSARVKNWVATAVNRVNHLGQYYLQVL